jgi:acyl-CoA synthetase (AMP-forming)/AMP-acid ligase II
MLLHEVVLDAARTIPGQPAIMCNEQVLTFGELADRVRRTALFVADLCPEGGRIAAIGENHPGWIDLYYGVPAAGRTLVFLNQRLSAPELRSLIGRSGASVVVGDPTHLDRLRVEGVEIPLVDWDRWKLECEALGDASIAPMPSASSDAIPAWLLFTSGTTAAPKGALLTHRSVMAAVAASSAARPVEPDDVYAFPFPLCHVAGYNVVHRHVHGRPVVLLDRFDPKTFCAAVEARRATSTSLAATMLASLLDHVDAVPGASEDLRTLRSIAYGAAPMPPSLLRRADAALGVDFAQGYGMTELSGNAVFLDAEAHRRGLADEPGLLAAAGRPAPGVEVRIADAEDVDVRSGEVGEILVRADQMMIGYLDDPEASEAALRGGWLHTGDIGRIDDGGYLHVLDRSKDVIITGGENVSSREVEDVVAAFPGVMRVAVVGVPDARWGENICAVIVSSEGDRPDPAELAAFVRSRLAGFKVPRHVVFIAELPVNASGKVLKAQLRALLAEDPQLLGPRL